MTLGEKIYSLRVKNGLSQEAFGEKLGVSQQPDLVVPVKRLKTVGVVKG